MLDFIGTIVLAAAIIVSINALTGAMPISPSQRIALSVGAGLWTGLAAALAGASLFLGKNPVGPPMIGTVIAFPMVATAVAASISSSVRASLLGMPMPFLIGLNVWRVAGGFFLLLAAEDFDDDDAGQVLLQSRRDFTRALARGLVDRLDALVEDAQEEGDADGTASYDTTGWTQLSATTFERNGAYWLNFPF